MSPEEVTAREFDAALVGVRGSIEDLARAVTDGAARSTLEHAEVRRDLRDLRDDVGELRRQVDTAVVSRDEHDRLKQYLYARLDAVEADTATRMRRPTIGQLVAIGGLAVALAGFLVGVL